MPITINRYNDLIFNGFSKKGISGMEKFMTFFDLRANNRSGEPFAYTISSNSPDSLFFLTLSHKKIFPFIVI
jgi:hypothetical protein